MDEHPDGYRLTPAGGARLRSDIIDLYVFRRVSEASDRLVGRIELLQLHRATEPMGRTWQPVMGHVEAGETCAECALREMGEEVGLLRGDPALVGVWQLEQVQPYFFAAIDSIVLSPRFCAEVASGWEPVLDASHDGHRWVSIERADGAFMWPGQMAAIREIASVIAVASSRSRVALRLV